MGKLLGKIFRDDLKTSILWLVLPLVFAIIFTQLLKVFGENPLVMVGTSLSITMVVLGPFVALISVAINDYERFYGKYAAFFSSLPYQAKTITLARFINYLLMGLVAVVFAIVSFFFLIGILAYKPIGLSDIIEILSKGIAKLGMGNIIAILIYTIFAAIVSIMNLIFAISLGASRIFAKPSKAKAVLIFIITSLIIGLVFARIQVSSFLTYENLEYIGQSKANVELMVGNSLEYRAMLVPVAFNIIISALLAFISNYIHNKKLSVA